MPVAIATYNRCNPADVQTIAQFLRSSRRSLRVTQDFVSQKSGVSVQTISNYETGRVQQPRFDELRAVLAALGKTEEDLNRATGITDTSSSIVIQDRNGEQTKMPIDLVIQAEAAAIEAKKSLADWVIRAISAYLQKPTISPTPNRH